MCFVRQRVGDAMVLATYGRSSGFCIDPIEKKPLNHFHPGIERAVVRHRGLQPGVQVLPELGHLEEPRDGPADGCGVARAHRRRRRAPRGAASVAFTYNDPVIFAEYAMDTADACHALGLHSVAVTAGYMHAAPRREFYAKMDAANVDLKGFTEKFYFQQTGAHLAPVLDTLQYLRHETDCWFEITTLLIPGHNDSSAEIDAMTRWIADHLGPDVPLHFTAFHPDYKMLDVAPTPPATLTRARAIALGNGLHHVYTGNVHDVEGGTTFCPRCHAALVRRDWYEVLSCKLDASGACPHCGTADRGPLRRLRARLRPAADSGAGSSSSLKVGVCLCPAIAI